MHSPPSTRRCARRWSRRPGAPAWGTGRSCATTFMVRAPLAEPAPTEIPILADDSADPAYVAADLIAQAEHDELASCLLVTDAADLVDRVEVELDRQVATTRHIERVKAAL